MLISFVTRTCKRPRLLVSNIESLLKQSSEDWDHVLLVDNVGRGLEYANRMFWESMNEVTGRYVYILDDDNVLADNHIVADFARVAERVGWPKVVFCKTRVNEYVMPQPWRDPRCISRGNIDSACFFVELELWKKYIERFAQPHAGDFHFIQAMWLGEENDKFAWWDRLVSYSMRWRPYGERTE